MLRRVKKVKGTHDSRHTQIQHRLALICLFAVLELHASCQHTGTKQTACVDVLLKYLLRQYSSDSSEVKGRRQSLSRTPFVYEWNIDHQRPSAALTLGHQAELATGTCRNRLSFPPLLTTNVSQLQSAGYPLLTTFLTLDTE